MRGPRTLGCSSHGAPTLISQKMLKELFRPLEGSRRAPIDPAAVLWLSQRVIHACTNVSFSIARLWINHHNTCSLCGCLSAWIAVIEAPTKQHCYEQLDTTSQVSLWSLFWNLQLIISQPWRIDRPWFDSLQSWRKSKSSNIYTFCSTRDLCLYWVHLKTPVLSSNRCAIPSQTHQLAVSATLINNQKGCNWDHTSL